MTIDPSITAETKVGFDDFRRGDFAALESQFGPQLQSPDVPAKLAQLRAYVPTTEPIGHKVVGWNVVDLSGGQQTVDISEEYDFGDRDVLWTTHLDKASASAPWQIDGVHAQSSTVAALATNGFSLSGKKPVQYLFLLATILSPALMVVALIKVIRTSGLRRKWFWGVAAFLGVFSFQMNWATGQIFPNWVTVQLIGAGATRGNSAFVAWVLTMTLPLGAGLILSGIWANPKRAAKRPNAEAASSAPPNGL